MCPPQPLPPGMFDLEGLFLGFSDHHPAKAKYILLAVEQEQMAIKVPKEMRYYLRAHLKIGDRIRCIGRSQVDFKSGVIKLNAYQLFPLASGVFSGWGSSISADLEHAEIGSQSAD